MSGNFFKQNMQIGDTVCITISDLNKFLRRNKLGIRLFSMLKDKSTK